MLLTYRAVAVPRAKLISPFAAAETPTIPVAPPLRLLSSSVAAAPDWHLFTRVLDFLLDARDPDDLTRRAAASIGLLPQVEWTDLDGGPSDAASVAIQLEHVGEEERGMRWFQVRLTDPTDAAGRQIIHTLLAFVAKLHGREREAQHLADAAYSDPLTGLWNRAYFDDRWGNEVERVRRHNHPMSLAVIDLDHFKSINDTYGHGVGDEVLRRFAHIIHDALREADYTGRLGGEEFVLVLSQTALREAGQVASVSDIAQPRRQSPPLRIPRLWDW